MSQLLHAGALMILILWSTLPIACAQHDTITTREYVPYFSMSGHYGKVFAHSPRLEPVRNATPLGITLHFVRHKISQRAWTSCHCYPKVGLSIGVWDLGNTKILGQAVIGMFYVEPVFGAWNRFSFSLRAGTGFSYQTRPYHPVSNPMNFSYSTRFAFPLHISLHQYYRLNTSWNLFLSATYDHISNGGIREPNAGINWPGISVGTGYYIHPTLFINRGKTDWRTTVDRFYRVEGSMYIAFKEPKSKVYLFSPGIEIKGLARVGRLSNVSLGTEWTFDNALAFHINEANQDTSPQRLSVAAGHEFILGRFLFSQQFGYYAWKPYSKGADVWQRYGIIYPIWKNLYFGSNLKVHGHISQQLDLRLSWRY